MMRKSDPVDLFMQWYNYDRPHMSLGSDGEETPAQAFCAQDAAQRRSSNRRADRGGVSCSIREELLFVFHTTSARA